MEHKFKKQVNGFDILLTVKKQGKANDYFNHEWEKKYEHVEGETLVLPTEVGADYYRPKQRPLSDYKSHTTAFLELIADLDSFDYTVSAEAEVNGKVIKSEEFMIQWSPYHEYLLEEKAFIRLEEDEYGTEFLYELESLEEV